MSIRSINIVTNTIGPSIPETMGTFMFQPADKNMDDEVATYDPESGTGDIRRSSRYQLYLTEQDYRIILQYKHNR